MAATNYVVGIRIQYPKDTNLADVNATLRNEATNKSETLTSNSAGEVVWNVGNLPSGFARGNKITVFSLYQGFQQSFSFAIPNIGESVVVRDNSNVSVGTATGGGLNGILVLVAVPTAPSLRYFTVQEFLDYFNLKEYGTDVDNTEYNTKTQRIVLVGQSVELNIDNDTRTKFDDNSGAYYSVTDEYHDARFDRHNNYYLKSVPVIRMTKFEVNQRDEGSDVVFENLVHDQIDAMDATTGWTASTDGAIALNSTPSQVNEGSVSLNIRKTGATVAAVTYSKTFSTSYEFFERKLNVDYYIETATNLASTDAIALRFGTDSSNYYEQTFDRADVTAGAWKTLGFARKDTGVTVTGSPGTSALNYFAIVVTADAAGTTITGANQRLDDLRLNEKNRVNLDTDTGRVRITDSDDYADAGKRHVRSTYTYGRSSVPVDIKLLSIIETGLHILGASFIKSRIGEKSDSTHGELAWFDSYRQRIINKYKNPLLLPT